MSYTVDRTSAAATARWVGIASNMVAFLDAWLGADASDRPEAPPRTLTSAHRFLEWVLNGIKLDRREAAPTSASLCNLTIAVDVLTSLPVNPADNMGDVESRVKDYASVVQDLEERRHVAQERVEPLRVFFEELRRQANAARYEEMAQGERPLG